MMSRRKGELTGAGIDYGWPHQVAFPARQGSKDYHVIADFCRDLTLCPRGHSVFHNNEWFQVYCFAEAEHAAKFMARFGGERFDPDDRGRGAAWAQWNRK
jgi:hypothetical protein